MTLQKQLTFWLIALFALIFSLWMLKAILLPFIAGLVLAYFLDPVADKLEEIGLPRWLASLIILLAAIFALAIALLLLIPVLGD